MAGLGELFGLDEMDDMVLRSAKKEPINFRSFHYILNSRYFSAKRVRAADAFLPYLLILSTLFGREKA